jgi:phosphoribosyl-AMP cyclohydrolase
MRKQQYPEPTVGALIFNQEGKALLVKSHKWRNKYCVPGGHIELGETMEDALRREIKEETGLPLEPYTRRLIEGLRPEVASDPIEIKFDSRGLVTAVVQDATTGDVLMVAWMNAEALRLTRETGEAHFWSRSRKEMWRKGATSGNVLRVREIRVDCDADTLLLRVSPAGPACHTGARSCFFRTLE